MALPDLLDTWNRLTDAIYYGNDVASGTLVPSSRTISTTAPITGGGDLSANRTIGITLTGGGSGAVGTGRTIATTAPLTGGGTLAADLTLALTTSPVGQTPVGVTRTITTTTPLKIDGGASANLSADRTLSVIPFTGAVDGIVTHNAAGVQGKYLKDDNTWGTSAVAGVSDITATTPLAASASTGSVTLSVTDVGIATKGVMPATGGVDATKFACATSPVTWAVPGLGGFVRLQGSTPGTADVGSAHIDGTLIADDVVIAGAAAGAGIGVIESISDVGLFGFLGRAAGVTASPSIRMQRSLGTIAAPTATSANTVLGSLVASGYTSLGGWNGNISAGLQVKADGTPSTTEQPAYTDIIAGSVGVPAYLRLSTAGVRINAGSTPGSSVRATSTLDLIGSLAVKITTKTASFNCDSASTSYILDASAATVNATLPDPTTCAGRIYSFVKVDDTFRVSNIIASPQAINGVSAIVLRARYDCAIVQSDGSNWFTLSRSLAQYPQFNNRSDGSAVGASSTAEQVAYAIGGYVAASAGEKIFLRAKGIYSTNATPTLHFRVRAADDGTGAVLADFFTFTAPSGVTNAYWDMHCEWTVRTLAAGSIDTSVNGPCVLRYGDANGLLIGYGSSTTAPAGAALQASMGVTIQFGTSHASNTVTVKDFSLGNTPYTAAP